MRDDEFIRLMKSTIVRSKRRHPARPLVRVAGATLSMLAPRLAARLAERLFLTPPRHRPPANEAAVLATARSHVIRIEERRLQTWTWDGPGPTVLLLHGWGGRGGQLAGFVGPLLAQGFAVTTFDAPGHGASEGGQVTVPEMVAAARAVGTAHAPLAGVVAHSLGAVAATAALREGLELDAAVFIAPRAELVSSAVLFASELGLSRRVRELMQQRIERRAGRPWSAFDVVRLAPSLAVPLLVLHDRGDGEVPWQHGLSIARTWPGAELVTTDGLGHRRILRDPGLAAAAATFIAARAGRIHSARVVEAAM